MDLADCFELIDAPEGAVYRWDVDPVFLPVVAAARSVLNGQTVWWCESHESKEFASDDETHVICERAVYDLEFGEDDGKQCVLAVRLLVEPTEET